MSKGREDITAIKDSTSGSYYRAPILFCRPTTTTHSSKSATEKKCSAVAGGHGVPIMGPRRAAAVAAAVSTGTG